jgi:large subunit ribosomal protein L27
MASKKAGGSTQNGRDSEAKRLGIKLFGGQKVSIGGIIVRQRGTKWKNDPQTTFLGKDYTIHAKIDGVVTYFKGLGDRTIVGVLPLEA